MPLLGWCEVVVRVSSKTTLPLAVFQKLGDAFRIEQDYLIHSDAQRSFMHFGGAA